MHVERGQIGADGIHHARDRDLAHERQPFAFRLGGEREAMRGGKLAADGAQVIAGIEALGDGADVLAQRLAVAQEGRACQHVDLGAGIVDVIFARHLVAGESEQIGERVAEHGAAAMADMHRAGGIGADIFDIDLFAGPEAATAVIGASGKRGAQFRGPDMGLQRQVDEAGPGDGDGGDVVVAAQRGGDFFGKVARLLLGVLGQNHGGIGGHVAVARVARRLDQDAREIGIGAEHGSAGRVDADEQGREKVRRLGGGRRHSGERVVEIGWGVKRDGDASRRINMSSRLPSPISTRAAEIY